MNELELEIKNLDTLRRANIQRFFRFLKNKGYFGRFIKCTYFYPSTSFTFDKWLNVSTQLEQLTVYVPFEWVDNNTSALNNERFWEEVDKAWKQEIRFNKI